MKSVILRSYGFENIAIEETEKPHVKPNEAIVRVGAVALNYVDLFFAKGVLKRPLPYLLGSDAAGIIESTGSEIKNFKVGDVVSTHAMRNWQSGEVKEEYTYLENRSRGTFSEYISLPENAMVKAPSNLSFEEIATLPVAGLTAWNAIYNVGKIRAGQTVLLQGTGGVSIFGLQFAKLAGAKVIITSGSNEKLEKVKSLGADIGINYKEVPDWSSRVLELTNGKGVDMALEVVGSELDKTIKTVRVGGSIALVGIVGGSRAEINVVELIGRIIKIQSVEVGSKDMFEEMNKAIELNNMKPVIGNIFTLSEITKAMFYMEKGEHFGKVVVKF